MNTHRTVLSLTLFAASSACSTAGVPLTTASEALLARPIASHGALVYEGTVVPRGHDAPAFRYERRVAAAEDGKQVSTHVTLTLGGTPVVVHRAVHASDYRLVRFEETHAQLGLANAVEVREDGALHFTQRRGDTLETHDEGPGAPVVVGPTLFGHVIAHLPALRRGETLHVRFAATDRGRSYAFLLRGRRTGSHETTVDMLAANPLVRLGLAPMRIVFDDRTGLPVAYHGRVPPRLDGRPFEADVRYRHTTTRYR